VPVNPSAINSTVVTAQTVDATAGIAVPGTFTVATTTTNSTTADSTTNDATDELTPAFMSYLEEIFPSAQAQLRDFIAHSAGRAGQVYSDVLIVNLLTHVSTTLGVSAGSKFTARFRSASGESGTISYFDVLRWFGLSISTAGRMRTLYNRIRDAHSLLLQVQQRDDESLTTSEKELVSQLAILLDTNLSSPLLPKPTIARCPPLTMSQYTAATARRGPFDKLLQDIQKKYGAYNSST
jgi:hypothetical protein